MAVTEIKKSGTTILKCDECPDMPDYNIDPPQAAWSLSCVHIEVFIVEYEDSGTLKPNTKYQMNISPIASYLCRDPWASWVTFETGAAYPDRGGIMSVDFRYDSEFYTSSSGSLGFIMPEDGRQSVRDTLWDWTTTELLKRQPTADTQGISCPQRTHSASDQQQFISDCGMQAGLNAHIACVVFENCCAYCYRKTMGQDANFGMAGVSQPQQPRPGSRPQTPSQTQVSTSRATLYTAPTQGSTSQASNFTSIGTATSVSVTPSGPKPGQSMAEYLNDPNLPF